MLDKKYGMNYSMPHSVVHIVDNSMYTGELPVTVVDDPSLLSTLVVSGAPMGEDRRMIPINRSDVLNVAYGMKDLTTADIEKYGQTITYPSALLAQDVPVKFMRITPDDATYAFVCLLIQWRWDGFNMHVRFNTTAGNGNNGLPLGVIHSNFKNVEKLNSTLVASNKTDNFEDDDKTIWKQRVFMTSIAAGRGSEYNKFSFSINGMQAKNHPANARYNFITLDTLTDQIYESFEASLINQNNGNRLDSTDSVNVAVSKRVPGSSILVPTVNESAIKELYADYMSHLKEMIDSNIDPIGGTVKWADIVYKTLNINTFDPIYGLYIYNGDVDVSLPYFQVDMFKSDIPRLAETNRLTVYLDDGEQVLSDYLVNPEILNSTLNDITYGIGEYDATTKKNTYHVGDVFLSVKGVSAGISLITSINQYTGSVTSIPINKIRQFNADGSIIENSDDVIRAAVTVSGAATEANIKSAVTDLIARRKLIPRGTVDNVAGVINYAPDYISVVQDDATLANEATGLNNFVIAKISYKPKTITTATATSDPEISETNGVVIKSAATDLYTLFIYPSTTVVSFATRETDEYFNTPGTTVIVTWESNDAEYPTGSVYVNGYYRNDSGVIVDKFKVQSTKQFMVGTVPTSVSGTVDIYDDSYDVIVYQDTSESGGTGVNVSWSVTGGKPVATVENTPPAGYVANDLVTFDGVNTPFVVRSVESGAPTQLEPYVIIAQNNAVAPNKYATTGAYTIISTDPYTAIDGSTTEYVDGLFVTKETTTVGDVTTTTYTLVTGSEPEDWATAENKYYGGFDSSVSKVFNPTTGSFSPITGSGESRIPWNSNHDGIWVNDAAGRSGLSVEVSDSDIRVSVPDGTTPSVIQRYVIAGTIGSLYRYAQNPMIIPADYYSDSYGINPSSEEGGIGIEGGYSGFFDDNINDIEFKWRYSALLVRAYKGEIDPRIMSPTRCPAKFLFDGATNTIVGQTILPYMTYKPIDIINASTIFTEDEKEACVIDSSIIKNIKEFTDIDVKQAMYDLMVYRCYYGMPEDKRPIGPGFGLALHLDSGITDANTSMLVNQSFAKRFNNPNASWDIGGYTSTVDGITYTYTQRLVSNLFRHIKATSINKPFAGTVSNIEPNEYSSFFPDVDTTDWELRQLFYKSGGNAWIMDTNGNLQRKSQKSLYREDETSDLVQENNMRTLSQLCYLLQNKIDSYLLAYNDDGVLKTLKDECDNMFSNWIGDLVTTLDITFKRDIDPNDGGEIVVCYVTVTFRGLILRVPIIVNVQRRVTNT